MVKKKKSEKTDRTLLYIYHTPRDGSRVLIIEAIIDVYYANIKYNHVCVCALFHVTLVIFKTNIVVWHTGNM